MNVEKIKRLVRRLRRLRHEEHYKQSTWVEKTGCGTAACIAGHALLLEGYRPRKVKEYTGDTGHYMLVGPDREFPVVEPGDAAAEVLELDGWIAGWLFAHNPGIYWPPAFAARWAKARDPKTRKRDRERPSRIAADLLEALAAGEVQR